MLRFELDTMNITYLRDLFDLVKLTAEVENKERNVTVNIYGTNSENETYLIGRAMLIPYTQFSHYPLSKLYFVSLDFFCSKRKLINICRDIKNGITPRIRLKRLANYVKNPPRYGRVKKEYVIDSVRSGKFVVRNGRTKTVGGDIYVWVMGSGYKNSFDNYTTRIPLIYKLF